MHAAIRFFIVLCVPADTCDVLQSKEASNGTAEDLAGLAGKALLKRYARDAEDKMPLVTSTLKAQGLL